MHVSWLSTAAGKGSHTRLGCGFVTYLAALLCPADQSGPLVAVHA